MSSSRALFTLSPHVSIRSLDLVFLKNRGDLLICKGDLAEERPFYKGDFCLRKFETTGEGVLDDESNLVSAGLVTRV